MTRNQNRDLIYSTCMPNRSYSTRPSNCLRNLGIRPGLAARDLGERLPDLPLERSGLHIDRQIESRLYAVQVRDDLARPPCQRAIIPRDGRRWILVGQYALEISIGVPHRDRTNAA